MPSKYIILVPLKTRLTNCCSKRSGWYFTILESDEDMDGETSGLAFSPDGMHMYFSYQHNGIIFDVWREDGRPFHAKTLSVKYHETGQARSR